MILGFSTLAYDLAEFFREKHADIYVIDLDYRLHDILDFSYKGHRARAPRIDDGLGTTTPGQVRLFDARGATVAPAPDVGGAGTPLSEQLGEFAVDGAHFGQGTNVFSIYADPESPATWAKYRLLHASLVVACLCSLCLRCTLCGCGGRAGPECWEGTSLCASSLRS